MALSKLSGDEQGVIFIQLCNALEPRLAVYFSSASHELWELTQALRQQLRADHEAAAALCHKVERCCSTELGGELRSCKELRETTVIEWVHQGLSAAELALLGRLGSVLPALERLVLLDFSGVAGPEGVQQLAAGLGKGALPAVTFLQIVSIQLGDAGASELAAALGRGALPRLKSLYLYANAIVDADLVALALALRRLPALETLALSDNPLGDEGLAALVAPPPPAGALPPPAGVLTKLQRLDLRHTQITDAGCAALVAALDSGALPALETLDLRDTPASAVAKAAVHQARDNLLVQESGSEESDSEDE